MRYRIAASDIDDTLLRSDLTISQSTKDTILNFQARGGVFVLSTGRMYPSARALAGELGVSYQTMRNWKAADKWEEALPKKKRGGQPGNQNSKGKRNAAGSHDGAPPGNKNAEKDGAYSTVFFAFCRRIEDHRECAAGRA